MTDTELRIWDDYEPLWDVARRVVAVKAIPSHCPQPEGLMPSLPTPAVNLGTPRMKIGLWGPPESLTLSIAKTDVWDRRRGWETPLTLEEVQRGAFDPANAPSPNHKVPLRGEKGYLLPGGGRGERYGSWLAYPFPCPKPVGQVIVRCDAFADAPAPQAHVHFDGSPAQVALRAGGASLEMSYLDMMDRNLIGIRLRGAGLAEAVTVRLYRHRDTVGVFGTEAEPGEKGYDYEKDAAWNGPMDAPESGADGRLLWIRQCFPAEKTFPDGFEYVLTALAPEGATVATVPAGRGLGTPVRLPEDWRKLPLSRLIPTSERESAAEGTAVDVTFPPGENVDTVVWLAIATTAEADDPAAEARRQLDEASRRGFDALTQENRDWYRRFYEKRESGRIFCGGREQDRQQIPALASSWRSAEGWLTNPDPARFEADEKYAYLEADRHPWHGLACLNEIYYTSAAVRNRDDRQRFYVQLVRHWLDAARKNAREVFDLPGMLIAHGYLPPIVADEYPHTISTWEFCMEIAAQTLKPAWDTWDYGGDDNLLTELLYPALKDLAIFYAAFITPDEDGRYHVIPTVSAEHWGWTYRFERNRDGVTAMAMVAWTLDCAASAAAYLGRDEELQAQWRRIAEAMAPYPTWPTEEGVVYGDVADVDPTVQGYNFFPGVMPTVLADRITLDSPREQIDTMLRTASLTAGWKNQSVFHLLGAYPDRIKGVRAPELFAEKPDVMLDSPAARREAFEQEPERLLNSRGGRIHLFPCVPPDCTVAFREFQARGGFLVSAEMRNGDITFVRITARRDVPCRLANPWPGETPEVVECTADGSQRRTFRPSGGDTLEWPAQRGMSYELRR